MTMNNEAPDAFSTSLNATSTAAIMSRHQQQQHVVLASRPRITTTTTNNNNVLSPLSKFRSIFKRRPVRRALVELGRNDRKSNVKLAEDLLTISVENFKDKWNFDPIKMKPMAANNNNNVKFEWELLKGKHSKQQQTELNRTVSSVFAINNRTSLTVPIITTADTVTTTRLVAEGETNNSTAAVVDTIKESTLPSTTNAQQLKITESINSTASIIKANNSDETTTTAMINDELKKRLSVDTIHGPEPTTTTTTTTTIVALVTVPTVKCSSSNSNGCLRQSKITDFARQRKRLHSSSIDSKLEGYHSEVSNPPPAKRPRV